MKRVNQVVSLVVIIVLAAGSGFAGGWYGSHRNSSSLSSQKQVISSESSLISQIAKEVGVSVVSVNVTGQVAAQTDVFGRVVAGGQQQSAGTGFFVSGDGVIITNRHVVPAGTTDVNVVMSDGTKLDVTVLGRTGDNDPLDVAFLKVKDAKGKKFTPATLGDSSKLQVGDKVVAIGNALGQFQNTVTAGIISGFGRQVQAGDSSNGGTEDLQDLFQTDAAINEGNSGGPLVNINGQVIGINTAIAGGAQNIGFAIPSSDVTNVIKGVLTTGKLERPYLGVHYASINDDLAASQNLPVKRGAYLPTTGGSVIDGSPAATAGLQAGDIITKVNNTSIDENNSLSSVLGRLSVGGKAALTVLRGGKTLTITAMLGAAPQN